MGEPCVPHTLRDSQDLSAKSPGHALLGRGLGEGAYLVVPVTLAVTLWERERGGESGPQGPTRRPQGRSERRGGGSGGALARGPGGQQELPRPEPHGRRGASTREQTRSAGRSAPTPQGRHRRCEPWSRSPSQGSPLLAPGPQSPPRGQGGQGGQDRPGRGCSSRVGCWGVRPTCPQYSRVDSTCRFCRFWEHNRPNDPVLFPSSEQSSEPSDSPRKAMKEKPTPQPRDGRLTVRCSQAIGRCHTWPRDTGAQPHSREEAAPAPRASSGGRGPHGWLKAGDRGHSREATGGRGRPGYRRPVRTEPCRGGGTRGQQSPGGDWHCRTVCAWRAGRGAAAVVCGRGLREVRSP